MNGFNQSANRSTAKWISLSLAACLLVTGCRNYRPLSWAKRHIDCYVSSPEQSTPLEEPTAEVASLPVHTPAPAPVDDVIPDANAKKETDGKKQVDVKAEVAEKQESKKLSLKMLTDPFVKLHQDKKTPEKKVIEPKTAVKTKPTVPGNAYEPEMAVVKSKVDEKQPTDVPVKSAKPQPAAKPAAKLAAKPEARPTAKPTKEASDSAIAKAKPAIELPSLPIDEKPQPQATANKSEFRRIPDNMSVPTEKPQAVVNAAPTLPLEKETKPAPTKQPAPVAVEKTDKPIVALTKTPQVEQQPQAETKLPLPPAPTTAAVTKPRQPQMASAPKAKPVEKPAPKINLNINPTWKQLDNQQQPVADAKTKANEEDTWKVLPERSVVKTEKPEPKLSLPIVEKPKTSIPGVPMMELPLPKPAAEKVETPVVEKPAVKANTPVAKAPAPASIPQPKPVVKPQIEPAIPLPPTVKPDQGRLPDLPIVKQPQRTQSVVVRNEPELPSKQMTQEIALAPSVPNLDTKISQQPIGDDVIPVDLPAIRVMEAEECYNVIFDQENSIYVCSKQGIIQVTEAGIISKWSPVRETRGHQILSDGSHLVSSTDLHAVVKLDDRGQIVEHVSKNCNGISLRGPRAFAVDSDGGFYFTDPGFRPIRNPIGKLHYVDAEGRTYLLASQLAYPEGLALNADQTKLYVVESQNQRILEYDIAAPGKIAGERTYIDFSKENSLGINADPSGLYIDDVGKLYVSLQGRHQVRVYDLAGGKLLAKYITREIAPRDLVVAGPGNRFLFFSGTDTQQRNNAGGLYRLNLQ